VVNEKYLQTAHSRSISLLLLLIFTIQIISLQRTENLGLLEDKDEGLTAYSFPRAKIC